MIHAPFDQRSTRSMGWRGVGGQLRAMSAAQIPDTIALILWVLAQCNDGVQKCTIVLLNQILH